MSDKKNKKSNQETPQKTSENNNTSHSTGIIKELRDTDSQNTSREIR